MSNISETDLLLLIINMQTNQKHTYKHRKVIFTLTLLFYFVIIDT